MTPLPAFVLALLLAVPLFTHAQSAVDAEIREAEERLARALLAGDVAAFETLLAPEFLLRGVPDVPRATWIANARALCWGDRYDISDFRVVRGTNVSAIVAVVLTTNRDPETCEPAVIRSLLTDVWERRTGGWQLVLRHSGPAGAITAQFAKGPVPPPRWERSAELSLVATGGNTDTQTLGLGGALVWRPGPWTTNLHGSFVRSATGGIETARTTGARVRQSRSLTPRLDTFGRLEYFANEFAGVDHRVSIDAGLGWKLLEHAAHRLRADAGFGYSREDRLTGDDLGFALINIGSDYRWRISRWAALSDAALVTASLQERQDWRFTHASSLTTTMTRLLAVRLSHELKYSRTPAQGFERTDTISSAALVLKF